MSTAEERAAEKKKRLDEQNAAAEKARQEDLEAFTRLKAQYEYFINDPHTPDSIKQKYQAELAAAQSQLEEGDRLRQSSNNGAYDYRSDPYAAEEDIARYRQMGQERNDRAPILADYAQSDQSRGEQGSALGLYRDAAMGRGPSAAQAQFQHGLDQSLAAGQSIANSARGGALGLAQARLAAAQQGGAMLAGATSQAAALRAHEMQAAMSGYGGLASQMRGQDLNAAQFQADLGLRNRGMNDQTQLAYEQMGQGVAGADLQARMAHNAALSGANQQSQQNAANAAANLNASNARAQATYQGVASLVPVVGGIAAGAGGAAANSAGATSNTAGTPVAYNGSNAGNVATAGMVGSATPPSPARPPAPTSSGIASAMSDDDPYRRRMRYA